MKKQKVHLQSQFETRYKAAWCGTPSWRVRHWAKDLSEVTCERCRKNYEAVLQAQPWRF